MRRGATVVIMAGLAAAAGCSGVKASQASRSYLKDQLAAYALPRACEDVWAEALKVTANAGYSLVGRDRLVVGQTEQGAISQFFSRGHTSYRDDKGVYESESDANASYVRMRVRGTPAGPQACKVEYTAFQEDRVNQGVNPVEAYWRDYDLELELVSRVSPDDGSRIAHGMDEAAAKYGK